MECSTIEMMKQMASDQRKAEALVEDETCLGGLVMVLSNADTSVVKLSLEALQSLAEWPQHRPRMKHFLGMMEQLQALMAGSCATVQELAQKLYNVLQSEPSSGPLRDTVNTSWDTSQEKTKFVKPKRRNSFFVGGSAKGKSIVLYIKDLISREDIEACRNCLVRVKGVISITFDARKRRTILRARPELMPETVAHAITKHTGLVSEQVVKDDNGEEVYFSFSADADELNKENDTMPDYPSDSDSPVKKDTTLTSVGGPTKEDHSWKFIKSVGSFLSNSFYW